MAGHEVPVRCVSDRPVPLVVHGDYRWLDGGHCRSHRVEYLGMTYTRKYRPPYTRKPPPALLAADALWDEARDEDRRLEALEAELALMSDEYDFGGPL